MPNFQQQNVFLFLFSTQIKQSLVAASLPDCMGIKYIFFYGYQIKRSLGKEDFKYIFEINVLIKVQIDGSLRGNNN